MFLFLPPHIVRSFVLVRNSLVLSFVVWALFTSFSSFAELQPRGVNLSYGQKALSNNGNAASASLAIKRKDVHVISGGMLSIKAGAEYGDMDEIFSKLNELLPILNHPSMMAEMAAATTGLIGMIFLTSTLNLKIG